jgi:hypothetical protein
MQKKVLLYICSSFISDCQIDDKGAVNWVFFRQEIQNSDRQNAVLTEEMCDDIGAKFEHSS